LQHVTPGTAVTPVVVHSVPAGEQGFVPAEAAQFASVVKDVMPHGAPLQHWVNPCGGAMLAPTQHCSPEYLQLVAGEAVVVPVPQTPLTQVSPVAQIPA
jgi:hypothetical protein